MADAAPRSDLRTRTLSAIVLIALAAGALIAGGGVLLLFVLLVTGLVYWEWQGLVLRFPDGNAVKALWLAGGLLYVGGAAWAIIQLGTAPRIMLIALVIATDVGAYFAGRTIGGPKIAPAISPSKTWAGLGGGMLAAALIALGVYIFTAAAFTGDPERSSNAPWFDPALAAMLALTGALVAVVAQAGDFFESWMKRRAGVKDSGTLIPGHGGMFDRVDGLLLAALASGLGMSFLRIV